MTSEKLKIGQVVYLGISSVKHVVTHVVNEYQVEITNKRVYEDDCRCPSWLVSITSLSTENPCKKRKQTKLTLRGGLTS
jgi:hypothetical protein